MPIFHFVSIFLWKYISTWVRCADLCLKLCSTHAHICIYIAKQSKSLVAFAKTRVQPTCYVTPRPSPDVLSDLVMRYAIYHCHSDFKITFLHQCATLLVLLIQQHRRRRRHQIFSVRLTCMNCIVMADFPTPPPPTTTNLYVCICIFVRCDVQFSVFFYCYTVREKNSTRNTRVYRHSRLPSHINISPTVSCWLVDTATDVCNAALPSDIAIKLILSYIQQIVITPTTNSNNSYKYL